MRRMSRTLAVLAVLALFVAASAWAQLSAPGVFPISKTKVNVTLIADTRTHIDDYAKLEVMQYLEKLTNVHVTWKTVPASVEAVSLSLASSEEADGYWTSNGGYGITSDQLEQYGVQEKMFMPLDALIEKNMPNYKKAIAAVPNGVGLTKSTDGKIYSLPQIDYCQHCEHSGQDVDQPDLAGQARPQGPHDPR